MADFGIAQGGRALALFPLMLAQANAEAGAVLVDELDASDFESSPYNFHRGSPGGVGAGLKVSNCHNADGCLLGQVALVPIQKASRSPALFWRDHRYPARRA
jgi:hypothetical protein